MVDYMGAALGMVIIFVAAVFFFSGMITNGVAYSTQRNYALAAQNLFDYILLSPGSPQQWGTSVAQPSAFGLAQPNAPEYTLSPGSILRITPMTPTTIRGNKYYNLSIGGVTVIEPSNYYVNYTYAKQLLGIAGSYEFQLTLTPALNVSVQNISTGKFLVTVTGYGGTPIPGAQITAQYVYAFNSTSGQLEVGVYTSSSTTNTSGQAELTFQVQEAYYLLVQVSAAGITGAGYYSSLMGASPLAYISVFPGSQNVTLTQHCAINNNPSCGEDNYNVTLLIPSGVNGYSLNTICACPTGSGGNGSCLNAGSHSNVSCPGSFYDGYVAVAIAQRGYGHISSPTGHGKHSSLQILLVPVSPPFFGLKLVYGYSPQGSSSAVTLTRIVEIGGVSYVAQFVYWPDIGPVYGGY